MQATPRYTSLFRAITTDGAGSRFTFDAENRLLTGGGATYDYDGDGRRVRKTRGSDQTFFLYDAAGSLAAEYTLGTPPASPCTTCYLTADHLGSTRLITDPAAAPISRLDYAPFGEELLVPTGSPRFGIAGYGADADTGIRQKFTGKERDTETGLDYFGARYMSSAQGRFVSVDWAAQPEAVPYAKFEDPQSLNLYQYVRNRPLSLVDEDGHEAKKSQALTGTAAQLLNDGLQRIRYNQAASKLSGPDASQARRALQSSTYSSLSPIGRALTDQMKSSRTEQLVGKSAQQLAESASRTNAGVNTLGKVAAGVGAVGIIVGVGSVAVETANAPQGKKLETAASGGSRLAASLGGAQLGAEIAAPTGPVGALIGSILGGIAGDQLVKAVQNHKPMDETTRIQLGVLP